MIGADETDEGADAPPPLLARGRRWRSAAAAIARRGGARETWTGVARAVRERYAGRGRRVQTVVRRARPSDDGVALREPGADPVGLPATAGSGPAPDRRRDERRPAGEGHRAGVGTVAAGAVQGRAGGIAGRGGSEPSGGAAAPERSSPAVIAPHLEGFLTRVIGARVPRVELRADRAAADRAARSAADALAYPDRIEFGTGKLDLQSSAGVALLGHELTHVARMRQGAAATPEGAITAAESEERAARRAERAVLDRFPPSRAGGTDVPAADRGAVGEGTFGARAAAVEAPWAAPSGRDLGPPEAGATAAPALSARQLDAIKEEVYRDLRGRLRTEFERGG